MDTAVFTLSLAALLLGITSRWQFSGVWVDLAGRMHPARAPSAQIRLLPGERPIALICPDRELCLLRLALTVAMLAVWIRILTLGGMPLGVPPLVLVAAIIALPVLAESTRAMHGGWLVTDRRLIARSGAAIPLSALRRIAVGPTAVIVEAADDRSFALSGLANARAAAQVIHRAALGREEV